MSCWVVRAFALCVIALSTVHSARSQTASETTRPLVDYVNTLQGTNSRFEFSHGNTFPAVALPYGMHMWTPQTGRNGDGWKYQYEKDAIRGFQQSHQCSSWSNDYAVFSLMPVVGELTVGDNARAARFRHEDETGRPHLYGVKLATGVTVEMAPTERGAFLQFSFPAKGDAYVVLDGYTGESAVAIDRERRRVSGYVRNGRYLQPNFRNYFVLEFSVPFAAVGTWQHESPDRGPNALSPDATQAEGRGVGAYLRFPPGSTVRVKVASSYISPEQAERNLDRELGRFDSVADASAAAADVWNRHLGKVVVEDPEVSNLETFYSCYFRSSLFPHAFFEFDAAGAPQYFSPYDGQVHAGYLYTDTGFWDTFRAQFPLHTLLHPTLHGRYLTGLVDAYRQCGWLPSWSFPGEQGSMIGNHAISLFADAWVKGIRTFDPAEVLAAYEHEATHKGPWGPANGREGFEHYNTLGYVPYPEHGEATAKTLEYAYDDWCGYQLAKAAGVCPNLSLPEKKTDAGKMGLTPSPRGFDDYADRFARTMFNYKNVFDPSTGFVRGRNARGEWQPANFDPTEWGGPFIEGCAWHWQWSVFHDVSGLVELMGGDRAFCDRIDALVAAPNTYRVGTYGAAIHEMREMAAANMGQYAHANQPIQHMPYLYSYAGEPWKTQQLVRRVMRELYSAGPNGYPGDEDQGQTSAWYVQSALGFYSVCPGTGEYVLGSPLFEKTTLHLENGKRFTIRANNNSPENVYIESATLNGKQFTRNYLRHEELVTGGELVLKMSAEPNTTRGKAEEDHPYSVSDKH
ncbi:MAG: GH92 family glycosyl hydrolase [Pirellulales bacterium]